MQRPEEARPWASEGREADRGIGHVDVVSNILVDRGSTPRTSTIVSLGFLGREDDEGPVLDEGYRAFSLRGLCANDTEVRHTCRGCWDSSELVEGFASRDDRNRHGIRCVRCDRVLRGSARKRR